ncbi:Uncharacterised protein [Legionella lansingensis]|uniref:Coiled-coil protein n=1 Tax=Legionella lansingensis TaxID=45067 RepID=A0A0W0VRF0_9GAMM|nr:hypothetical protein [Legionella lansingensis]KTD22791.1 hypothetical protein Llan_1032 [Legionella lansingensis]SNV49811.1 Uncharacterised protein [Legionella lansingensis]
MVFFEKGAGYTTYNKLLRETERNLRLARIAQAEASLQQLKKDIDNHISTFQEVLSFVETQHALYEEFAKKYASKPSVSLGTQLAELKKEIDDLDVKIKQAQPEKVIADMSTRYQELKAELEQKKALINSSNEPIELTIQPK